MYTHLSTPRNFRTFKLHPQQTGLRYSSSLKKRIGELVPEKVKEINEVKKLHGEKVLGTCTVNQAYGGVRDVSCLVTETSLLDANEVIFFFF